MEMLGLSATLVTIMNAISTNNQTPVSGAKPISRQHTPQVAQLDSFNIVQTDSEESKVEELVSNAEKDGARMMAEPQGRPVLMFFAAWGRNRFMM